VAEEGSGRRSSDAAKELAIEQQLEFIKPSILPYTPPIKSVAPQLTPFYSLRLPLRTLSQLHPALPTLKQQNVHQQQLIRTSTTRRGGRRGSLYVVCRGRVRSGTRVAHKASPCIFADRLQVIGAREGAIKVCIGSFVLQETTEPNAEPLNRERSSPDPSLHCE
jgi:hypothetical protein